MSRLFFRRKHIIYSIPDNGGDANRLWGISSMPPSNSAFGVENIKDSAISRLLHAKRTPSKYNKLFKRVEEVEGKGSLMAYRIIANHPSDPLIILGIDTGTNQLFSARYAYNEQQLISVSKEYDVLEKLQDSGIVPTILEYKPDINNSFLKVSMPEGKNLAGTEMNDGILEFLLYLTQFSISHHGEENALGLITCLSNGSFAPWNIILDDNGNYHLLQWQHAADRPLGYDLIYFLLKPFSENEDMETDSAIKNLLVWLQKFYSQFGIEDFGLYLDACCRAYAARLESQQRYVEANRIRLINTLATNHYYEKYRNASVNVIERPKVLFVLHMPPPVHGASMVGKWIHESEYINAMFDCYYINLTAANGLTDIGKFNFGKMFRFFTLINTVKSLIKQIKPELVYITPNAGGTAFIKDSILVNVIKSMGCGVIAHLHNKGFSRYQGKALYNYLYKKFFHNLKVLLIVPSLYEDANAYLRIRDVYFCPNGTPLSIDYEPVAERHHDTIEIMYLSNMLISKGVIDLLDALYLLRSSNHKFHCTLIGAETDELNQADIDYEIRSRNLDGYVDFVGPRYGDGKREFFEKADIMAFPTYYPKECFPLVILEAMEYKLPIVSTNEGGIPYEVKDNVNGLVCKKQNPIDLYEALLKLMENPELRWKMGEAGYKMRKELFTFDTFENNLATILHRAINDIKQQSRINKRNTKQ